MNNLTNKQQDIMFQYWYGSFDYNDETAEDYKFLKENGYLDKEYLDKVFGSNYELKIEPKE